MSTSRRESILANIKTTLDGVKIANGYENTLASVQRWKRSGNILNNMPCVIVNAGIEFKEAGPNPQKTCTFMVHLEIWHRQDEEGTSDTDTLLNSLLLDVEKSLMVDATRGGYAVDTKVGSIVPFETLDGKPDFGAFVELEIIYQHAFDDPAAYA
jgi:hypothetical protein